MESGPPEYLFRLFQQNRRALIGMDHSFLIRRMGDEEIQLPVHRVKIIHPVAQPGFPEHRVGHAVGGAKAGGDDVENTNPRRIEIIQVKILGREGFKGKAIHALAVDFNLIPALLFYQSNVHDACASLFSLVVKKVYHISTAK